MEEKINKNEKIIKIIAKWFLIAVVLFFIIQLCGGIVIKVVTDSDNKGSFDKFQSDYIGHWYNGTFFINMMVSENFETKETYKNYVKEKEQNEMLKTSNTVNHISMIITISLLILCFAFTVR